jgi:flagellar motor switch protein FliM
MIQEEAFKNYKNFKKNFENSKKLQKIKNPKEEQKIPVVLGSVEVDDEVEVRNFEITLPRMQLDWISEFMLPGRMKRVRVKAKNRGTTLSPNS